MGLALLSIAPTERDVEIALRLDAQTNKVFWRERPLSHFASERAWKSWNARFAGKEALTRIDSHGYYYGRLFRHHLKAHRVIWLLHYGRWPNGDIDHINGVRSDNSIDNLREVGRAGNQRNHKLHKDNSSGVMGVSWTPRNKRWRARIGRPAKHLGYFDTFESAVSARKAAERQMDYHANHGRSA
jgi:hypothetical protein